MGLRERIRKEGGGVVWVETRIRRALRRVESLGMGVGGRIRKKGGVVWMAFGSGRLGLVLSLGPVGDQVGRVGLSGWVSSSRGGVECSG